MKEEVVVLQSSSTSTRIETTIAFEEEAAAKNSLEATFLGGCGLLEKVEEEDRPAKNGEDQLASTQYVKILKKVPFTRNVALTVQSDSKGF